MRSDFSLNTENNNQHNNSEQLTITGRNTADFTVFPPEAGVFFSKKDPSGVNSKVRGGCISFYF